MSEQVLREQRDQPNSSEVKMHTPGTTISTPAEFCSLIREHKQGRLILTATENGINHEPCDLSISFNPQTSRIKRNSPSVSLATVLEERKLKDNDELKILLSYLLAKAVWKFYDSHWMTNSWTKETIHFMPEYTEDMAGKLKAGEVVTLIHRPFLATDIKPNYQKTDPNSSSRLHNDPRIVALGIMLLEIQLEEGIEKYRSDNDLDENGEPEENADSFTALRILGSPAWKSRNVYQAVKDMIEICFKDVNGRLGTNTDAVRENLYTYIVLPLGRLFKQGWSENGDPETFDPNPITFKPDELSSHDSAWPDDVTVMNGGMYPINQGSDLGDGQLDQQAPEARYVRFTFNPLCDDWFPYIAPTYLIIESTYLVLELYNGKRINGLKIFSFS